MASLVETIEFVDNILNFSHRKQFKLMVENNRNKYFIHIRLNKNIMLLGVQMILYIHYSKTQCT